MRVGCEHAVEVGGAEEVAVGGGRRGASSARRRRGRRRAGRGSSRRRGPARARSPPPGCGGPGGGRWAGSSLQRRVGDLDDVALGRAGERRGPEPVADEDLTSPVRAPVDLRGIERPSPHRRCRAFPYMLRRHCHDRGRRDEAGVAVGRDRVALGGAGDLADDQGRAASSAPRRPRSAACGWRPRRRGTGRLRKNSPPAAASPRSEISSARAFTGSPRRRRPHSNRSAAAARNSSGSTPQTSQSSVGASPWPRRWPRIVPS